MKVKTKPSKPAEPDDVIEARDHTTGDLLAIDPSIASSGVALFRGGILIGAGRIRVEPSKREIGARCMRMAHEILSWAIGCQAEPRTLAIEWPQVYRAVKSPGDPNDLIGLAGVGMAVAGALAVAVAQRNITLEVLSPTPAQWAGQLPKSKTVKTAKGSPRALRIYSRLSPEETIVVPNSHDALDAVGIGLHALGRLDPVRRFAGAVA